MTRPAYGSRRMSCDGIQYILSFADPTITKNVIINLSYGPTTGPHDGTAELESALTALVTISTALLESPSLRSSCRRAMPT